MDDSRGGIETRQYTLSVPDTIPPAIALNAPTRANPGTTINVAARASDNQAITAVEIAGDRTDYTEPYENSAIQQKQITLPSGIGTHTIRAMTWDPSGNSAETTATVEIAAAFDTTPPQIFLKAPPQVTPGQTVPLSASVSDEVGVSTITFSADGTDIGTTPAPTSHCSIPDPFRGNRRQHHSVYSYRCGFQREFG